MFSLISGVILKRVLSDIPKGEELKQKLFEDALSKPIEEKVSFDDVVLDKETKDEIVSIMDTFKNDKQFQSQFKEWGYLK